MLPHSNSNARGYVLAGGASSRFGRDKALVRFGAIPLLQEIVQLAQTCTSEVAVVAGAQKYVDLGGEFEIIEDRWPGEGPLGGIITALQHTAATNRSAEWNLMLSCDMPFLTAELLVFLVAAASTRSATSNLTLSCVIPCLPAEWLRLLAPPAGATHKEIQVILPHSAHG